MTDNDAADHPGPPYICTLYKLRKVLWSSPHATAQLITVHAATEHTDDEGNTILAVFGRPGVPHAHIRRPKTTTYSDITADALAILIDTPKQPRHPMGRALAALVSQRLPDYRVHHATTRDTNQSAEPKTATLITISVHTPADPAHNAAVTLNGNHPITADAQLADLTARTLTYKLNQKKE